MDEQSIYLTVSVPGQNEKTFRLQDPGHHVIKLGSLKITVENRTQHCEGCYHHCYECNCRDDCFCSECGCGY